MNRSPGRKDEVTAGQVRPERFKKGLKYFVLAKSFLSVGALCSLFLEPQEIISSTFF